MGKLRIEDLKFPENIVSQRGAFVFTERYFVHVDPYKNTLDIVELDIIKRAHLRWFEDTRALTLAKILTGVTFILLLLVRFEESPIHDFWFLPILSAIGAVYYFIKWWISRGARLELYGEYDKEPILPPFPVSYETGLALINDLLKAKSAREFRNQNL